jgi:CheY-like chemotaxis protein
MGAPEEWKSCLADGVSKALESAQLFSIPIPDEASLRELIGSLSVECSDAEIPAGVLDGAEAPQPTDTVPGADSPHLLVIDDEPQLGKMIKAMLRPDGIKVRSCEGPDEALPLAAGAFAILCDVHLGSVEGMEVVRELRRQGYTGPIIMMSGDRTRSTVEQSIEAGIDDYLVKPFDRRLLLAKLQRHLPVAALADQQVVIPVRPESSAPCAPACRA